MTYAIADDPAGGRAVSPLPGPQFEAWRARALPPVDTVRDGILSIPIPFPGPVRFTYCYVLKAPDGVILLDPGWASDEGWETLVAGLEPFGGVAAVRRVVMTHFHTDHVGMAARIVEASGAEVLMHPDDQAFLRRPVAPDQDGWDDAWLRGLGVPEATRRQLSSAAASWPRLDAAEPMGALVDGMVIPATAGSLRILHTPGHSPGHVCVVVDEQELIFTGDHIMPRIVPGLGFAVDRSGDPLADYLASLRRCEPFSDYEAAPAHEYRFRGLPGRIADLVAAKADRTEQVLGAMGEAPIPVWEVAASIPWRRAWRHMDPQAQVSAALETRAHLVYLAGRGRIPAHFGS